VITRFHTIISTFRDTFQWNGRGHVSGVSSQVRSRCCYSAGQFQLIQSP